MKLMHSSVKGLCLKACLAFGLTSGITFIAASPASAESLTSELSRSRALLAQALSPGEQANASFQDKLSGSALLNALKGGGYVIYFRHAQTERDYADQADPNMSLGDCATQRKLSKRGVQDARDIGAAFTTKGIPVGKVITSEYCRSWQTANLAFGRVDKKDSRLNFLPYEDYTDDLVALMKKNVMPLLSASVPSGTNIVIVGHDDIFEAATGIYPDPQGIAYIAKPDGRGGFTLVANVLPSEWAAL
ncbi:MAG: histidine phosphatase family protein [Cyanobacteria bacterium J06638_7]